MLNDSIQYQHGVLCIEGLPVEDIVRECGTPLFIYSETRILHNYRRIQYAFPDAHIHYSSKANANLSILRTLIEAGAGIDAVSGGEIYRALTAGAKPADIVFAGVGKSRKEIRYAVEQGIGWFNVENIGECRLINDAVAELNLSPLRVALRFNPDVTANTHPYIATGHGGAKFGLTAEVIKHLLDRQKDYPQLNFAGIHIHIGSQLHDINATVEAVKKALALVQSYTSVKTINLGGGLPIAYQPGQTMPDVDVFASALRPLLDGYDVLLEPGRSIIGDAGILVTEMLYVKKQAGQTFAIVDASMTELIRPALYQAHHEIIPVRETNDVRNSTNVVGPVCETADVLGRQIMLPELQSGDLLAILTTGAYGMVMSSNYNARPRPAEVIVSDKGWAIARRRETWQDLIQQEQRLE